MILIDAIYIYQTGGKNLLELLIDQLEKKSSKEEIIILMDNRVKEFFRNKQFKEIKIEFYKGSELIRYQYYLRNRKKFRRVFCFANVPPPIKLDCEVITYFQNVLLLDKNIQEYFPYKHRIFLRLKKHIIKRRLGNTSSYVVQTSQVKTLIVNSLHYNVAQIKIIPFFNDKILLKPTKIEEKESAFFYPATGLVHKNHDRLLQAWSNLYQNGKIKASLHLTIDANSKNLIYQKINELQKKGVSIVNHGYLHKLEIDKLYTKCKFVIHPSLGESFGLVLIEAVKNNCILLAPDLPYVREIVSPNYYFDALNIDSIEKSILQAISGDNFSNAKILTNNEVMKVVNCILS